MRRSIFYAIMLCLFVGMASRRVTGEDIQKRGEQRGHEFNFDVGVAEIDITPEEGATLAGSPNPKKTSLIDTRLFVKSLVISARGQTLVIVTLDTLKYPTDLAVKARKQIEEITGIPAGHVIICSSHTHSAPLWPYYKDRLVTSIGKSVRLSLNDLEPCKLGLSKGKAEGLSKNRRVLIDGEAWNSWRLKYRKQFRPSGQENYPAAGPVDPEFETLAVVGKDGKYKAILYNFACHGTATRIAAISADFPGHVQQHVREQLRYPVPTLFLTGACGDINPGGSSNRDFAKKLGGGILKSLESIAYIDRPMIQIQSRELEMPGRQSPEFQENEISLKWPMQLKHYRKAFEVMKQREKPGYRFLFTGIRIGDDFAIITNPTELFSEIGLRIKRGSPFPHTMVVEQTNGARGYVPTAKAFDEGGYETWYGEHSYLSTRAGGIIEKESLEILEQLGK